jgi:HAD superfamily hydrolase (TIGR01490 family)
LNAVYLYLLFKLKLRDPLRIIDDMVGWVKGMRETDMAKLCSEVLNDTLLYSVFSEARKEINFHKNNGVKVIILSSTLDYICRSMSENLGMDGFICSSLESKDGLFTGRPVGRLCYGEEKLERLTGYCSTNTIDHSCLWYYADSISDLPVLNAVGHPVCINPDRKLNREALKRGWKTLRWSN